MFKKNKKLYTGILIAIAFCATILFFTNHKEERKSIIQTQTTQSQTKVEAGEIVANLPSNTILYDALVQAKANGKINFSGRNYPGLGFFVTDIGTLHAGGGKNSIYYINGVEATVGISSYMLRNGDIIKWKLE